ncbi:hypothetical protein [Brucella abortus]|uniref:hypothetical protein n=1 Tax=Brucella abortus TaxID=235 RepID=UPI0002CFE7F0|nr:hypothetical protein [Brucella abortus]ENP34133.1 hypothetical protein C088_02895 [Brucella abortus 65/110]ENQ02922.1 hypothetical protein C031_02081 [Brucella abortus F6/05-2]ENR84049.1 hypothetical protein B996_03149 [Brucella abortus 78/14]ENR94156.1 hypothetical protein B973_03168 [Brucella abortus 80/28]ENS03556.1 hypothetical protein B974_03159 [Brucella abortus 87/28]
MSALSISRYLTDFSIHHIDDKAVEIITAPVPPKPLTPVAGEAAEKPAAVGQEQAEMAAVIALEEEKRAAFEAGREDGHREAQVLYEAEKARLLREHEAEIETLRAIFSREQALLLAGSLTEALSALEQSLSGQMAEILMPLLAAKMEHEAVAEFARRIAALALEGEAPEISGPARLLEALQAHGVLLPSGCRFSETASNELSFSFGERMLETRIAPLLEELKAAVK